MRRLVIVMVGSMLWGASLCAAQGAQGASATNPGDVPALLSDPSAFLVSSAAQAPGQPSWIVEGRACEGCPPRSVGRAVFQTTVVNVFYGLANIARG